MTSPLLNSLRKRFREVIILCLGGLKNREVAEVLGLSPRTVEYYRRQALNQLGVANLAELSARDGVPDESRNARQRYEAILEEPRMPPLAFMQLHQRPESQPIYQSPEIQNVLFLAQKVLPELVGGVIVEIVTDIDGPYATPSVGLAVRTTAGRTRIAWIDSDPGQNGPGWVKVEDDHTAKGTGRTL